MCVASLHAFSIGIKAVVDETSNPVDASNSTEKVSEKRTAKEVLQSINQWLEKTELVIDTINEIMNTVNEYVATTRELTIASQKVYSIIQNQERFLNAISNNENLLSIERNKYINSIVYEIQEITKYFELMLQLSGGRGKSHSITGKMDDGKRLLILREYLKYINFSCDRINSIYYESIRVANYNRSQKDAYFNTMRMLGGL